MAEFLEAHNLPKLKEIEKANLNGSITSNEIEKINKTLPQTKAVV